MESTKPPQKLTKAEQKALVELSKVPAITSTAEVYYRLTRYGLAVSRGLMLSSRSRKGVTLKAGYSISPEGIKRLKTIEATA